MDSEPFLDTQYVIAAGARKILRFPDAGKHIFECKIHMKITRKFLFGMLDFKKIGLRPLLPAALRAAPLPAPLFFLYCVCTKPNAVKNTPPSWILEQITRGGVLN